MKNNGWKYTVPRCESERVRVVMSSRALRQVLELVSADSREFVLYGIVRRDDESQYRVLGFIIPKQSRTYTSFEVLEYPEQIARRLTRRGFELSCLLHKHPHGIRDFSIIDDDSCLRTEKINLLYCDGELIGRALVQVACGRYASVPCEIVLPHKFRELLTKKTLERQGILACDEDSFLAYDCLATRDSGASSAKRAKVNTLNSRRRIASIG